MARHRSIPVLHREQFQVGFLDGQRNHESITSKGGRHANLLHLEPAVLFFHGKLKPEASGISPHWIVAAKAVAGTLSAVRVKCPSPETPICWVVDHAEVYLDRYQYRSRAKKKLDTTSKNNCWTKTFNQCMKPELLAIKWMTDVEIVYLKNNI